MTIEEFYKALHDEQVAIYCVDENQWDVVVNTILATRPDYDNPYRKGYLFDYPWLCKWEGELCGYTGDAGCHPIRFTYEEFCSIHQIDSQPDEVVTLQGLEGLL